MQIGFWLLGIEHVHTEILIPEATYEQSGSFDEDLDKLQDILADDEPAYILARLDGDGTASQWLAINYVPESARVRDKVCNDGFYCILYVMTDILCLITDAVCVYSEFPDQITRLDSLY